MKNYNSKTTVVAVSLIIILIFAFLIFNSRGAGGHPEGTLDSFAQCLAAKNATMYGTYWCSHCKSQKAMFGSSFQYVPYVECTEETEKCLAAKVPTWIFADGTRLEGEQPLERLAAATGCALPESK